MTVWPSLTLAGGLRPSDPHQGGSAPLDPPKYGLGAPRMGIMCRPHGKMYFFVDFFIRALKLAANREKQVFTFFGFLPPYIGVLGLPVYLER